MRRIRLISAPFFSTASSHRVTVFGRQSACRSTSAVASSLRSGGYPVAVVVTPSAASQPARSRCVQSSLGIFFDHFGQLTGHQAELVGLHNVFGRSVLCQGVVERRLLDAEAEIFAVPLRRPHVFSSPISSSITCAVSIARFW